MTIRKEKKTTRYSTKERERERESGLLDVDQLFSIYCTVALVPA